MSRRAMGMSVAGAIVVALLSAGCQPTDTASDAPILIDLGDANSYAAWLKETGQEVDPLPFSADPLDVSATGEVRATPDVAVITATLSGEDPNESRALDAVSAQVNAVQMALADYAVETGFTAIGSEVKRDEACLNHNRDARQRHQQIVSDYWFNRRLDQRGDTETRRRPARPRIAEKVCAAEEIRVFTRMTVRIAPADAAGEVLVALGDAGAEDAQLLGYDFSDYDSLYQTAAERAVDLAQRKAQTIARGAGGTLGDLVEMSVDRPARLRRFGPQPRVVRAPRPRTGDGVSALQSFAQAQANHQGASKETMRRGARLFSPAPAPPPPPAMAMEYTDGFVGERITVEASPVVQDAQTEYISLPDGRVVERAIPSVTRMETKRVIPGEEMNMGGGAQTNALAMTLMSGPQIIRVSARLSYDYATPLDGMILTEDEAG